MKDCARSFISASRGLPANAGRLKKTTDGHRETLHVAFDNAQHKCYILNC